VIRPLIAGVSRFFHGGDIRDFVRFCRRVHLRNRCLLFNWRSYLRHAYFTRHHRRDDGRFTAVGGVPLLATGWDLGIKMFAVANMLPALVLAMPLSALWTTFCLSSRASSAKW
jgi:hypothetical protein